jgi:CheY-like chemotaxis protein
MRKMKVLVADDDHDFAESLAEILEMRGMTVELAFNGKEAYDKVIADSIDVLVLDLRMPIMDGLEVYESLREIGRVIPTIVVTAFMDEESETLDKLNRYLITGILSKPVDPVILINTLMRITMNGKKE